MGGGLTLFAALLLGLAASGHCLAMCGGISGALGVATARRADGRARVALLVAYQAGRVLSYALAGALVGGAVGGMVRLLDLDALRDALRMLSALALFIAALVAFGVWRDPFARLGRLVWPRLAPLGRRLLPVTSIGRALGFGMVWGWMPCGFAYTVIVIAALEHDAARSAATMLAFGLGTLPAMLASGWGAQRASRGAAGPVARRAAGGALVAGAMLTLFAPQLAAAVPWLHPVLPYLCRVTG